MLNKQWKWTIAGLGMVGISLFNLWQVVAGISSWLDIMCIPAAMFVALYCFCKGDI